MPRVVHGLHHGLPHQAGRAERAIEPRVVDHFDNRAHAAPFFAHQCAHRLSSNSTSLEAFERLPSLFFSRCRKKWLRVPSGVQRGSRKHDKPPGAWASTRNASHIGAEQNHLCPSGDIRRPVRRARPARRARCWRARRSRLAFRSSPCRAARPTFPSAGRNRGS